MKHLSLSAGCLLLTALCTGCASTSSLFPFGQEAAETPYEKAVNSFNYPDNVQLAECTAKENVNGSMPDSIIIKTLTQTFLKGWSFRLADGKIWAKQDGKADWSLFLETGLPFSRANPLIPGSGYFATPESVTEICADGDSLYAFDNKGRLYKVFTEKATTEGKFNWTAGYGWPEKKQLIQNELVKNKRGWAMGTRRKDVLWYEDIFGNPHHYGTMGLETIYFLTADGNEIRFTDSGLPVDLSKTIQMPEDGAFVARNIACSASTLFLIGDDGTMYTRLIDFDTMGCDPMFFKYSYEKHSQKNRGSDYLSNYDFWGLPAEPWKKQPAIPLAGKAALSRFITIFQNGHGNAARELRVAGIDTDGRTGYWKKQLNDEVWVFVPANLTLYPQDFLTGDESRRPRRVYSYKGFARLGKETEKNISVDIEDFSMTHEGDCTLTVTMTGENWQESRKIHLYTVAMWTYTPKVNPGFDGTPKDFFMTVDASPDDLKSEHAELTAFLESLFSHQCRKTFALTAQATGEYLEIHIPRKDKALETLFLRADGSENSITRNAASAGVNVLTEVYRMDALSAKTLSARYSDENLVLKDRVWKATPEDKNAIQECIARNREYRTFLASEIAYYAKQSRNSEKNRWRYRAADVLTTVTLLNQIDFPKIKTMTSHGSTLIETNADSFKAMHESRAFAYPSLIELIDVRIESYSRLLTALETVADSAHKESTQKDSYPAYYTSLALPAELTGKVKSAGVRGTLYQIPEQPFLSGLYLQLDADDEKNLQNQGKAIYIAPEDCAGTLYQLLQDIKKEGMRHLEKKPLSLSVRFYVLDEVRTLDNRSAGISYLEKRTGTLTWNGEQLKIRVKRRLKDKTLFSATVSEQTAAPEQAAK
ncbi:MAG: hypothetical protein K6G80_05935 [Treponema sp.]|nr:hypothetical protein [Treponema sp.]